MFQKVMCFCFPIFSRRRVSVFLDPDSQKMDIMSVRTVRTSSDVLDAGIGISLKFELVYSLNQTRRLPDLEDRTICGVIRKYPYFFTKIYTTLITVFTIEMNDPQHFTFYKNYCNGIGPRSTRSSAFYVWLKRLRIMT